MKYLFILFIFIFSHSVDAQNYFIERFNYESFEDIDQLYIVNDDSHIWRTDSALNADDITEDSLISKEEIFKTSQIVSDPFNKNNKVIRLELNRLPASFYAQYFCDGEEIDNVFDVKTLKITYNSDKDSYCIGCKKSPLGIKDNYWRNKMNRNEISTFGQNYRLYRAKRDHWFGVDLMLDSEYELESSGNPEILTQFHVAKKTMGYPPLALRIINDRFVLTHIRDNSGNLELYDLGPVIKNVWIQWKYHIRFSKRDRKAIIEVWRDNEILHSIKGSNLFRNYKFFLKIGIYKWAWWNCTFPKSNTKKKVIYFDNVWASNRDILKRVI
jgi:hypothetical protein